MHKMHAFMSDRLLLVLLWFTKSQENKYRLAAYIKFCIRCDYDRPLTIKRGVTSFSICKYNMLNGVHSDAGMVAVPILL